MFMDAPFRHDSAVYGTLLETLEARHVPVRQAERNRTIDIGGGATITLLTPPDPPIAHSRSDVNANSVVVRLDYGAVGVLFAADAEPQTERWLLGVRRAPARAGAQGRAPRRPLLVDGEVPARGVAAGGGDLGRRRRTSTATRRRRRIGRLERAHARVYRTDQDGTVTVETDGARIQVTTANGRREILAASR